MRVCRQHVQQSSVTAPVMLPRDDEQRNRLGKLPIAGLSSHLFGSSSRKSVKCSQRSASLLHLYKCLCMDVRVRVACFALAATIKVVVTSCCSTHKNQTTLQTQREWHKFTESDKQQKQSSETGSMQCFNASSWHFWFLICVRFLCAICSLKFFYLYIAPSHKHTHTPPALITWCLRSCVVAVCS